MEQNKKIGWDQIKRYTSVQKHIVLTSPHKIIKFKY